MHVSIFIYIYNMISPRIWPAAEGAEKGERV